MRLLVAEDERDLNEIILQKLKSEGYSVDGSPASKKALVEHTGGMMGIGAQSPINLGKKAVKIANAVLNGEDYEKETYEETFFINRDNVEMYGTDGWQ